MPKTSTSINIKWCMTHRHNRGVEDFVNGELEKFNVVQASEGQPVLTHDPDGYLLSVSLGGRVYSHHNSHSHVGHQVYLTHIETESGWLIIVTEGSHNSKNRRSVAFRSLTTLPV